MLRNGQPLERYSYLDRKRDAMEAIPQIQAREEYEARIMREDREGIVWTPEERQNIEDAIGWLRENKTQFTMAGHQTYQEIMLNHFHDDARCIESWRNGIGGDRSHNLTCAEIRRRRAATIEAFGRIGVYLDHSRWILVIARYVPGRWHLGWRDECIHESVDACRKAQESSERAIDRAGEVGYFFTILRGKDV